MSDTKCNNKECQREFDNNLDTCPYCGTKKDYIKEDYSDDNDSNSFCDDKCLKDFGKTEDKPNILLNIVCFVLPFTAWIPYLIYRKNTPKMAKSCLLCGFISSAIVSVFTLNALMFICAIIYATVYWAN